MVTYIELIKEDTDINSLDIEEKDWDVEINSIPYRVIRIRGYIHTVDSKHGRCDLWAHPRKEAPSFKNLLQFNAYNPVSWGIVCRPKNYVSHNANEVRNSSAVIVTRNGEKFYTCDARNINSGIDEARVAISKFNKHPLLLNAFGYDKKMVGRGVYFRGVPAIITRFVPEQACVMIKADDSNSSDFIVSGGLPIYPYEVGLMLNKAGELKVEILSDEIDFSVRCPKISEGAPDDLEKVFEGLDDEMVN